jgi:hypothetical protein
VSAYKSLLDVRQTYFRAIAAEHAQRWHLAVQGYLYCFQESSAAADERAVKFFAAKLSQAYGKMAMADKADYYKQLC